MLTIPSLATAAFGQMAELDSNQIKAIVQGWAGTGVLDGEQVTWNSAMTLAISSGHHCISGVWHFGSAVGATSSVSSDGTNPVWYILYINLSGYTLLRGTPAADPTLPALPDGAVLLAAIYLPAGASTISNSNILDQRVFLDARVWPRPTTVNVTAGSNYSAFHNEVVIISGGSPATNSTITLPAAAEGASITVKTLKTSGDGSVFAVHAGTGLIEGQSSDWTLTMIYQSYTFICDGTNWWVI